MKIFFYAGKCLPIHARTLEERPLGGTETGIIHVADILQRRGHDVTVFTSHRSPPLSEPHYLPAPLLRQAGACDAFVAVQDWWPLFVDVPARKRFFWTGDGPEQYLTYGIGDRRVYTRIDAFLGASNWHVDAMCDQSGFPREKAFAVHNGVHMPWFSGTEIRNSRRLIYASAPYRGLDIAAALFRELKKVFPDLELHVFAGLSVYDREKPFAGPQQKEFEKLSAMLQSLPGCVLHGNIRQQDLAREYMKSALLFYPNTIRETCCIVGLEAQAAGCPVVTSALGGLPETIGDAGIVVPGVPGSPEYMQAFFDASVRILSDQNLWATLSNNGLRRAREKYTWDLVAERLETSLITALNTGKSE